MLARPGRQRRRDGDLRGAAARRRTAREMERNLTEALGAPVERQGDHERGHGLRRPRRGHRLHSGGARRRRSVNRFRAAMDLRQIRSRSRARSSSARSARCPTCRSTSRRSPRPGVIRPIRPDKLARDRPRAGALGRLARRGDRRPRRSPTPTTTMLIDEARLAQLRARCTGARTRSPGRSRERGRAAGRRGRDHGAQPPRLRRRDPGGLEAGRQRALHEHRLLGPAARRRDRARGARRRWSTTRSSPSCSARPKEDTRRFVAWDRGRLEPTTRRTDELIEGDRRLRPRPARRVEPVRHPHLGHDRDAEGRPARPARHARPARGDVLADPAARRGEPTMIAAPLFHSWGFAHFLLGLVAQLDLRPAPQVRPRGDAEGDRGAAARRR